MLANGCMCLLRRIKEHCHYFESASEAASSGSDDEDYSDEDYSNDNEEDYSDED